MIAPLAIFRSLNFGWVYLFQGGRYESMSGLYDFRNREYSPTLARWFQNDPLGFQAGNSNFYRFVGDNPANATDPSGMAWETLASGTWERGKWGPVNSSFLTATIDVTLQKNDIGGQQSQIRLLYRVIPAKNTGTFEQMQEYLMSERQNTIKKGAGLVTDQKGQLNPAGAKADNVKSYDWVVDLGTINTGQNATYRGDLFLYNAKYLAEIKKGIVDREDPKPLPGGGKIIPPSDAAAQRVSWQVTVANGKITPFAPELEETGWSRDREGTDYKTAEPWPGGPCHYITPRTILKPKVEGKQGWPLRGQESGHIRYPNRFPGP